MSIPTQPFSLMSNAYWNVFPAVQIEINAWKKKAKAIPNPELRKQALASIETKMFHCQGGAIFALLAGHKRKKAIRFIVAYQTISDYLDNLCDRSTSLDPEDFAALHEAMSDALSLQSKQTNYYRYRTDQDDDGYLQALVTTCQTVLNQLEDYATIQPFLIELCDYYCNLQIHKHVAVEERIPRLKQWFQKIKNNLPTMEWYEFSACSGSTLGIFCLISYAMREDFQAEYAEKIRNGYFPYIQGLHILLDYFIDQEEDKLGGDLNFCFYYKNTQTLFDRLQHFLTEADRQTKSLPHQKFHQLINRGLLGLYLSDEKVNKQKGIKKIAKQFIKVGGPVSYFFYVNGILFRRVEKWLPSRPPIIKAEELT